MVSIITVHGTFAASGEDAGAQWWQQGSPFLEQLTKSLEGDFGELRIIPFHWSGKNSASERRKAARALLRLWLELETQGAGYHVIAHSHGGNVVWEALTLSVMGVPVERLPATRLIHLQTLTTVGTPFLRHSASRILLIPARLELGLGFFVLFGLPMMFLRFLDQSNFELWSSVGISALFLLAWESAVLWVASSEQYDDIQDEKAASGHAYEMYGDRCRFLWSADDEALSGLRASTKVSIPLLSHLSLVSKRDDEAWQKSLHDSWNPIPWLSFGKRLLLLPLGLLWGKVLAPLLDDLFWSSARRVATGADRPGSRIVDVHAGPDTDAGSPDPLPEKVGNEITDAADRNLAALAPSLRPMLMEVQSVGAASVATSLERLSEVGRVLVHNNYFHCPSLVSLISERISTVARRSGGDNQPAIRTEPTVGHSRGIGWLVADLLLLAALLGMGAGFIEEGDPYEIYRQVFRTITG